MVGEGKVCTTRRGLPSGTRSPVPGRELWRLSAVLLSHCSPPLPVGSPLPSPPAGSKVGKAAFEGSEFRRGRR